jgi:signal transduction histidine kinase
VQPGANKRIKNNNQRYSSGQWGSQMRASVSGSCYILLQLMFVICVYIGNTSAYADTVVLKNRSVSLFEHTEFLIDDRGLTIDEIRQPDNDARFTPHQHGRTLFGAHPVWLKITLSSDRQAISQWWLEILPASIDYITLYQIKPDGTVYTRDAGRLVPLSQREIVYRNTVFPVEIAPDASQVLYLKLQSPTHGVFKIMMWVPEMFQMRAIRAQLAWGIFLGIAGLLVVAGMLFERTVKDGIYGAFALYVFSCILVILTNTGLMYQYFLQWSATLLGLPLAMLASLLANVMGIRFFIRFTGVRELKPKQTHWYLIFVQVSASLIAAGLLTQDIVLARKVMMVFVSLVYMPCTIVLLWKPVLNGTNEIRYAFFASGLLLGLSVMLNFFVLVGFMTPDQLPEHVTPVLMLIFFLVIYYAISKRYQRMREEKDAVQSKILEMMRNSEQAMALQVAEKTADLRLAMADVEKALEQERQIYDEQKHFIAMVSHELRTPLAVIDAATHNIVREMQHSMSHMQGSLASIQSATEHLTALVSTHIDQSGIDTVSSDVHIQRTDLLPLFEDAITSVRPLAQHHQFVIDTPFPQTIEADAALMRLILRTLLSDMVGFTSAKAVITLGAETSEQYYRITIAATVEEALAHLPQPSDNPERMSLAGQLVGMHGGVLDDIAYCDGLLMARISLPKFDGHAGL